MPNNTQQQLLERYQKLPEDLKEAIFSVETAEIIQKISKKYGISREELNAESYRRAKLLYEIRKRNIFDFNEVQKIINEYHKDPNTVLAAFGIE